MRSAKTTKKRELKFFFNNTILIKMRCCTVVYVSVFFSNKSREQTIYHKIIQVGKDL